MRPPLRFVPVLLAASALAGGCLPLHNDRWARIGVAEDPPEPPPDPVQQARNRALWQISTLEIARPSAAAGFERWIADADPGVRSAAALALGRAGEAHRFAGGDPAEFVLLLRTRADDPDPDVRGAVAFAIGLIGTPSERWLAARFDAERDPEVRRRWLRAAGRMAALPPKPAGDAGASAGPAKRDGEVKGSAGPAAPAPPGAASEELELLGRSLSDPELADAAALALGVYGLRCERAGTEAALPPATLAALRERFAATAGESRVSAAYALWRLRQVSTTAELRQGLTDPHPRVRAYCARGLAAVPGAHARREVVRLLHDTSLVSRVEGARALGKLADADATAALSLVELLEESDPLQGRETAEASPHAAVAALESLGELRMRATFEPIRARLGSDDPYVFAAVVTALVKVAGTSALPDLEQSVAERAGADQWRARRSIVEALASLAPQAGVKPDPKTPADEVASVVPVESRALFRALLDDEDARVRAAALDSYAGLAGIAARARLVVALGTDDDAIVGAAAERLAALGDDAGAEAAPALVATLDRSIASAPDRAAGLVAPAAAIAKERAVPSLERAAQSPANGLMLAAAKALRELGRVPPARAEPPADSPTEAEWLAAADQSRVTVRTEKGDVTIQLRPDVAPMNVRQVVSLTKRGFYDGLAIHRVVPGFVTQGGDPRGDGWGGPGRFVPCELSDLPYERGTVGMALSGRDTGGSQLFVTLTPQPHLEANYTVIGKVVRGMEVVERLTIGDRIVQATVP